VVDQIPSAEPSSHLSLASTTTQVTQSECRALEKEDVAHEKNDESPSPRSKVVVDHLPSIDRQRRVDSVATQVRSLLSEVDEGEEDATKFGPVVDHLPTSRASLAPSRGGSTVDALATVSEAHRDEEESAAGWVDEDEVEFGGSIGDMSDVTEQAASRPKIRSLQGPETDRIVSVRFDASVTGLDAISRLATIASLMAPGESSWGTGKTVPTLLSDK